MTETISVLDNAVDVSESFSRAYIAVSVDGGRRRRRVKETSRRLRFGQSEIKAYIEVSERPSWRNLRFFMWGRVMPGSCASPARSFAKVASVWITML